MPGIGILGGTFDPVHNGHIRHALEAADVLGLERVFLMPCAVPPHKARFIMPFGLRAAMLHAAVQGVAGLDVTEIESGLPVPSYTWHTLQAWRELPYGGEPPYFMMGMESFLMLESWFRWQELPRLSRLVVVSREGEGLQAFGAKLAELWPGSRRAAHVGGRSERAVLPDGGELFFVSVPRLDISSTDVRSRFLAGKPLAGLVHPGVESLLEANRGTAEACWGRASGA
ncbi:MAG: nicotinate (nicotinamide) nucleotide adenylyltransferase [Mailhella sp.]|nr:nicotinate (nicotinamide) nucleotide adenylyltransferase [Mailhella sp.]